MPLARDVVKDLAVEHGAGVRPVQLRPVPGRLAPRPRTCHRTRRPHRRTEAVDRKARRRPGHAGRGRGTRRRHDRLGRGTSRTRRRDRQRWCARQRTARPARTPPPHDQAATGCPAATQPGPRPADGRQDLPPVAVRHAHLPVLRTRHAPTEPRPTPPATTAPRRPATRCTSHNDPPSPCLSTAFIVAYPGLATPGVPGVLPSS
jgi:hypothetical protein